METTSLARGTKRRYSGEQAISRPFSATNDASNDNAHNSNAGDPEILGEGSRTRPPCVRRALLCGGEGSTAAPKPKLAEHDQTTQGRKPEGRGEEYFRHLYSTEPDFAHLGLKYPEFRAVLEDGAHLDFRNPAAVVQLTKTLLKEHFGLQVNLPPDRLCPPVPNRHNYLLWLKDLLDSSSPSYLEQYEPGREVTGLDIGTGASLIYPLLGCAQRPKWHFVATDIDEESLASARANARANHLESRVRIMGRLASDPLIPVSDAGMGAIDFVMVNPPFYTSDAELLELAAQKSQPPHTACAGAPVEMVCEGGEVGFVGRMIDESLVLRDKVQWYTAMLGKQSSLEVLINTLKKHKINNFAVTTFIQGTKTRRWALGWSFLTRRPSLGASRGCSSLVTNKMLPPITAVSIYGPPPTEEAIQSIKEALCDTVGSLDLRSWVWDEQRLRGVGFANGNVWSRAYRRKRTGGNEKSTQNEAAATPVDLAGCAFGFSLSIQPDESAESSSNPKVILRWLQGDDASLFESFAGVVRRCLRKDAVLPG
ncbi:putative duf890 domain-containing protein [Rosellinia necatrix]|uniref:Putative duf890 domain-containing protein n=1 Tax=Rosellinia necatrix TaxID=77044 RepID=A0A1W2TTH9_ROSNE|nr:putative duf890 domain-containing protein [Rosellinia necatrix]